MWWIIDFLYSGEFTTKAIILKILHFNSNNNNNDDINEDEWEVFDFIKITQLLDD